MSAKLTAIEIKTDPLGRGYASMNAAQVQASLLTKDRTRTRVLNARELNAYAAGNGRHAKLHRAFHDGAATFTGLDGKDDSLVDAEMSVAISAYRMLERDDTSLDTEDPAQMALVDVLIGAGVWVPKDKTDILAMASESISRATEIGIVVPQKQADGSKADNVRIGWILRAGVPE